MRFAYTAVSSFPGNVMPRLILELRRYNREISVDALVDTGSSLNLMPYSAGLALGGDWDTAPDLPPLVGALGKIKARGLLVTYAHPIVTNGEPVELLFGWAENDLVPVLLGQMNFFRHFDVCFFLADGYFEVTRKLHG